MSNSSGKKIIAITSGDPEGIGPEIIEKCVKKHSACFPVVIFGRQKDFNNFNFQKIRDTSQLKKPGFYFFEVDPGNRDPSFAFLEDAALLALKGTVSAIVTAPINKSKWLEEGHNYMGHTDYLVKVSNTKKWVMFFWSEEIKTALFTTHIPVKDAIRRINRADLLDFCRFVYSELKKVSSCNYSLLMSGLNPHAGERGNIGKEDSEVISPVVDELKSEIPIEGPFPPDTIFLKALNTPDSVVISLYHDQGLIPFKLLKINTGVNVTLGLPFVRTSPDHGTAYDITGKGIADPGSMLESIKLAQRFLKNR